MTFATRRKRFPSPAPATRCLARVSRTAALALGCLFAASLAAHPAFAQAQTPAPPEAPGRVTNLNAYIEDPTVYARGQEPTHAPRTIPYETVEAARAANEPGTELEARFSRSPYFKLLSGGSWDFAFYERPADVPENYDTVEWEQIRVPKSWQTAGYDRFVYRNQPLTWTGLEEATNTTPPEVPDDYNPVGVYRRTFTVDDAWAEDGRRTFLHFEGVKQASFVWINGTYVGYDQGSATPAEYDVTDALDYDGENQITVQVYRFSDAEALETQDAVRFSGIHRSVYLFSKPAAHVRDVMVRTELDETHRAGMLTARAAVANESSEAGDFTVMSRLFDPEGARVATLSGSTTVAAGACDTVTLQATLDSVALWSAEKPRLYELGLMLAPSGSEEVLEAMVEQVGFREYEVSGGLFQVNGEPVNIRGVNRPEHSHLHGRHVPFQTLLEDVELMKRHEIDAIRTAHYPNDPSVYALADEYGLYVQDEVNVETHWNTRLVNEQPAYHAQMVERWRRMLKRDRNRPSIFTWSTGNEAGFGPAHRQMAEYARSLPGSYLLYHQDNTNATAPYSPLAGNRYPSVDSLRTLAGTDGKPLIMGEYRHAFGNGMGSFDTFWNWIQPPMPSPPDSLARLQGGFGWDWADQTVARSGGQPPFQRNGATDGIVSAERTPYPELKAVKDGHEPFAVRGVDLAAGQIEIGNHYDFTSFSEREVRWALSTSNGETLQSGTLEGMDLPSGEWTEATVPLEEPDSLSLGTDYWLTVELRLAEDRPWADAGHVIGTERLAVPFGAPPAPTVDPADFPALSVEESEGAITVTGEGFDYTFDKKQGTFSSLTYGGTEVLTGGPRLNLWRAPTLPDAAGYWGRIADDWRSAGLDSLTHEVQSVEVTETGAGPVRITAESAVRGRDTARAEVTYEYTVLGSGDVLVAVDMRPTEALRSALQSGVPSLPRVGVAFDVPTAQADSVRWYGRGPGGSFPDRTGGQRVGVYEGSVAGQFEPVVPPQINGVKTDTRWAALTGSEGGEVGLMVFADSLFAFGTNRFENLSEAGHVAALREADAVTVTLDHALMGAGTKFHAPPEETYVPPETVRFQVGLRPYDAAEEEPADLWRRRLVLPEALR